MECVPVILTADPGRSFKGFFISGDAEDAKTGFGGHFEPVPGQPAKASKFCVQGVTHTSKAPKTSVSVFWSPPANFTYGRVMFKWVNKPFSLDRLLGLICHSGTWPLATLWLTDKLSQSEPSRKRASLDSKTKTRCCYNPPQKKNQTKKTR